MTKFGYFYFFENSIFDVCKTWLLCLKIIMRLFREISKTVKRNNTICKPNAGT